MGHCHLISGRLEGRKKDKRTCDEDEAAIEGEEGSDAVEEVLEVDLVLEEGWGAVGAAELHEPAGKIHAHLLVPEPTNKHYYNYYNYIIIIRREGAWIGLGGGGGMNGSRVWGRRYSLCGGSTHWRCWSGSFFLQESRMSQRFLTPIAAGRRSRSRRRRRQEA